MSVGIALVQESKFAEGAAVLKTASLIWEGSGGCVSGPCYKCLLAEAAACLGDLEGAEQNYLAALNWARQQQAKSWELRTSTSLARP